MGLLSVIQTRLLKLWYYITYKTVICLYIRYSEKKKFSFFFVILTYLFVYFLVRSDCEYTS